MMEACRAATQTAQQAAALAARNAYERLIAYLSVQTKDVATAEDALGEAFLSALQTWPSQGIPANPEAWILVSARRKLIDQARRGQTKTKILNLLNPQGFEQPDVPPDNVSFPDKRLQLLFVCAHPAINAKLHTPLMLQTVLGLNAVQIGSAFLVAPATMGQRLVRIKAKIKDAGMLIQLSPTVGTQVGYAVAIAHTQSPNTALQYLNGLHNPKATQTYQPYWATKAYLLKAVGSYQTQVAYNQAIGLAEDPAVRDYLITQAKETNESVSGWR